jgi:CheY-like chemotaxis protein
MNSPLVWLLVGLGAVLLATWRLAVSRRRAAAMKAAREAAAQAALAQARQVAAPATLAKAPFPAQASAPRAGVAPDAAERRAAATARPSADPAPTARAAEDVKPPSRPKAAPTVVAFRAPASATTPSDASARPLAPVVPISRVASTAPSVEAAAVPPAAAAPRTPPPAVAFKTDAQIGVLLADDSKMVRVKTSKLLTAHGFQIVTAVDGLDAVRQLEGSLPDLVITDVDMPGMDGFGLTNHLRRTARTSHIPIVMITSAEDRHREEAMRVGVGLVLGKPYPEDALIAHIRSFRFPVAAELEPATATA